MQRVRLKRDGGQYFVRPRTDVRFIPTGCQMLDLALGGGWAEGRVSNIVGDKATGKTLLWIEAAANFVKKYPDGVVRVRETEAAFDEPYAETLGLPLEACDFGAEPLETAEDLFKDFQKCLAKPGPQLYVVDSMDALSDSNEMEMDITKGSYGMGKAKIMSQFFRRNTRAMEEKNMTLMIISQIRDKIGAMPFQKKWVRAGGRALDFYASQVAFLAQTGMVEKTIKGIKRPIGVSIQVRIEKNKVGLPYRRCEFDIFFQYGMDDEAASLKFLKDTKATEKTLSLRGVALRLEVEKQWYEVEQLFLRKDRKYD